MKIGPIIALSALAVGGLLLFGGKSEAPPKKLPPGFKPGPAPGTVQDETGRVVKTTGEIIDQAGKVIGFAKEIKDLFASSPSEVQADTGDYAPTNIPDSYGPGSNDTGSETMMAGLG